MDSKNFNNKRRISLDKYYEATQTHGLWRIEDLDWQRLQFYCVMFIIIFPVFRPFSTYSKALGICSKGYT